MLDAYTSDEVTDMAEHIEEICSPFDSIGWSSAGIYSFWNYDTKEILYIGLASDLYTRFKQHNGLSPINDSATKYQQIKEYFKTHEKLGYTILGQSPLSQPMVQRNEKKFRQYLNTPKNLPVGSYAGQEGIDYITDGEGQLIEAYRMTTGEIPKWNKIGGAINSRQFATKNNYSQIIQAFSLGDVKNPLVAKSTIRELAENPTYEWFEVQLHGLRMMMLTAGFSYYEAIEAQLLYNPSFQKYLDRMEKEGYIEKELII